MKLRVAVLFALIGLSIGLVVAVTPAEPAWACSCAPLSEADQRADLVVIGTITEVTETGVRLAVESVEKGTLEAGADVGLRVGRHEASCGYDFRAGRRYRVNSVDGATGLCVGVRPLPAAPPTTTAPTPSATAAAPPVGTAASAPARSTGGWWLAAGAALTVVAAGLVAVALRRRASRPGAGG